MEISQAAFIYSLRKERNGDDKNYDWKAHCAVGTNDTEDFTTSVALHKTRQAALGTMSSGP
jgi:hypothetical protein